MNFNSFCKSDTQNGFFLAKEKIFQVLKSDIPLPKLIEEAKENIDKKQKDLIMTQSYEYVYRKFIELASENHECPVCKRSFDDSHLPGFLNNVL